MERTRDDVIEDLNVALVAAGHSMRSASLALGLNHSYLAQFMRKNGYSPEVLPEDVRFNLAALLQVDEKIFRVPIRTGDFVNPAEGIKAYGKRAGGVGPDRRTTEMRVDDLLQEIGRIKERLDRLESSEPGEKPKIDSKTRPA